MRPRLPQAATSRSSAGPGAASRSIARRAAASASTWRRRSRRTDARRLRLRLVSRSSPSRSRVRTAARISGSASSARLVIVSRKASVSPSPAAAAVAIVPAASCALSRPRRIVSASGYLRASISDRTAPSPAGAVGAVCARSGPACAIIVMQASQQRQWTTRSKKFPNCTVDRKRFVGLKQPGAVLVPHVSVAPRREQVPRSGSRR